jgi:hypothetical protein
MRLSKIFGLSTILGLSSFAGTLTYTYSGFGSGTIGGTAFTDAAFTIAGIDNLANRVTGTHGYYIPDDSTTISINGVGTFGFTTPLLLADSTLNGWVELGFPASLDILTQGPANSEFLTWNMFSSIGPIAGPVTFFDWTDDTVGTADGTLVFTAFTSSVTFDATVTPEPSSGPAVGVGLMGVVLVVMRKVLRGSRPLRQGIWLRAPLRNLRRFPRHQPLRHI